ncbi:unnamed protein product [Rangifer tarandus platyrhynchus]|uniref:Uncharacterized protein n=2 Tax=Rangifer tarandus platyrhynchus TaxID=3082113 RepID=A0ABN8ZQB7_RANTA|nr:unnamed protein product [Rangifer tarandus platyrhynchus]CAI9709331.1 unnamed protein product [Rangifer tarandus platyrhynchus]
MQTFTPGQWEVSQADGSLPHEELTAGPVGVWAAKGPSSRAKPPQREGGGAAEGVRDPGGLHGELSGPRLTRAQRPRSGPASPVASEATCSRASPSFRAGLNRQGPVTPPGPPRTSGRRSPEDGPASKARGNAAPPTTARRRLAGRDPGRSRRRAPLPVAERK